VERPRHRTGGHPHEEAAGPVPAEVRVKRAATHPLVPAEARDPPAVARRPLGPCSPRWRAAEGRLVRPDGLRQRPPPWRACDPGGLRRGGRRRSSPCRRCRVGRASRPKRFASGSPTSSNRSSASMPRGAESKARAFSVRSRCADAIPTADPRSSSAPPPPAIPCGDQASMAGPRRRVPGVCGRLPRSRRAPEAGRSEAGSPSRQLPPGDAVRAAPGSRVITRDSLDNSCGPSIRASLGEGRAASPRRVPRRC